MKINGIDTRTLGGEQLKVELQPPEMVVNKELPSGAITPLELNNDIPLSRMNVDIYMKGRNEQEVRRSLSEIMALVKDSCVIDLDGYKDQFKGYLTGSSFEKTITKKRVIAKLRFDGYFFGEQIIRTFEPRENALTIVVDGTRPTPCIIRCTALMSVTDYTITGFRGGPITINHIGQNGILVIDGEKGLVTINGDNAFDRIDMWRFPELDPGSSIITTSDRSIDVEICYRPRWI